MEERTITDVPLTLIALPLFNASPTPPALRAGSPGGGGDLETRALPLLVAGNATLWELGSARRMAPQAPRKSTLTLVCTANPASAARWFARQSRSPTNPCTYRGGALPHPVGAPANGSAGASEKYANPGVYRQPRQRCALVRSAEPVSYKPMHLPRWYATPPCGSWALPGEWRRVMTPWFLHTLRR